MLYYCWGSDVPSFLFFLYTKNIIFNCVEQSADATAVSNLFMRSFKDQSHDLQTMDGSIIRSSDIWQRSEIRATEEKLCLTFQLSSHMIEWNKSMEKHCHHYYYWGERGSFSHLPDTFNRHCNLGLSCPRTSIANEFMKPFTGRSRTACLCRLAAGAEGSLLGPAGPWPSPWLWMGVQ